ncbi:unnamed protein product, partial [Mesorhabditis belari]|uniref:Uncharacterized protein n=1 Tax=Mesorhabditis belari TaxID=2138241 RepID=A0AAF3FPN3_9BILA
MVEIIALPETSMFDEDLDEFRIQNLQPNTDYFITLKLHHKNLFRSHARFHSDKNGEIDVGKAVAVHGHYTGRDKMGLFSSLYHEGTARFATKLSLMPMPEKLEYKILVQERHFYVPGKVIAEKSIWRVLRNSSLERIVVEEGIEGIVYKPPGPGPFPSILDIYGMLGTHEHRAALLANKGFAVLALTVIGGKTTPKAWQQTDASYFLKAVNWLASQRYASKTIGLIGISAGGTAALYIASKHSKISATVAINSGNYPTIHAVFKENGKLMPFFEAPFKDIIRMDFNRGAMNYAKIDNGGEIDEEYQFKIEESRGKFMFVAGDVDGGANATMNAKRLKERMERFGRGIDGELVILPHSGHNIEPPFVPVQDIVYAKNLDIVLDFGGHAYLQNVDQRKLWPKIVDFFKENIELHELSKL